MFIHEVTALVPVLMDCHYAFAVYTTQRTQQRWPLVLAAQTQTDMKDWVTVFEAERGTVRVKLRGLLVTPPVVSVLLCCSVEPVV